MCTEPFFQWKAYRDSGQNYENGSGIITWSEDLKEVNLTIATGSDAHAQLNYSGCEYKVTYF
jgi:hypothetical protein